MLPKALWAGNLALMAHGTEPKRPAPGGNKARRSSATSRKAATVSRSGTSASGSSPTARRLQRFEDAASTALAELRFSKPVEVVYDPTRHASKPHRMYLRKYGHSKKRVLLLGMNPGPYGMVQTGVPFGEVAATRDFLGIEAKVSAPDPEHPKRPVTGFQCTRSEVSGRRLWGWVAQRFGTADAFFKDHFVHNFCPLVFMADSGRNITPDKLLKAERDAMYAICDELLRQVTATLEPEVVVGVGAFAETRVRATLGDTVRVARLPHPSPASPAANKGWDALANRAFDEAGL